MAGLKHTMAAIPGGNTRRVYGVAYYDGARWWANVAGNPLDARWNPSIRPAQGLPIVVDITNDGQGQSTALVVCAYDDQPSPATGSVLSVGVGSVIFTGDDGGSYETDRFLGPIADYMPSDPVYLLWDADKPTILGVIADIAPPTLQAPPPPQVGQSSGQTAMVATASDTFGVGGWGRWATAGEDVYSGTQGAYTVTGAWFYGAPKPELAGKTATRIRFKIPGRLRGVGAYNSTVTVHLYAHTSQSRPGGDVSRVVGPVDVNIVAGFGGDYVDLPGEFFPILAAGGGISIAGNPYLGLYSRLDDPESGKILIDWSA